MPKNEVFIGGRCDFCGVVLRQSKHKVEESNWICSDCYYEDLNKHTVDWDLVRKDRDFQD
jgi:formylmethanofuran dehydrogenase subunit E